MCFFFTFCDNWWLNFLKKNFVEISSVIYNKYVLLSLIFIHTHGMFSLS